MAADDRDTAALMAEFLEFKAAKDAAAAADSDPDNDRDVAFTAADGTSMTLPWRKAKEFDLDGLLASKFGLTRRAPAAATGGDGDGGSTGSGQGKKTGGGKTPPAGQPGSGNLANLFRSQGQAKTG